MAIKSQSATVSSEETKAFELVKKTVKCMGKDTEVMYRKLPLRPERGQWAKKAKDEGRLPVFLFDGFGDFPELNPRTYEVSPGIICEQDVEVVMRDGCKTYADIYRPKDQTNVPCVIGWSWFGKRSCTDDSDPDEKSAYQTFGVPFGSYSKSCKFECPDPEYWCHKGYAVCNYDHRGVNNSEGDIEVTTQQEARDAYDLIEFLAALPWCNGKIGMSGDSGPAVAQWKAASANPPHLACIAPWEGVADTFRELICIGGIPESGFNPYLVYSFFGKNDMEDYYQNTKLHPCFDDYWKEKIALLENIDVPAYITAGWTHFHLRGSTDAFQRIRSKQKWIRIHRDFEWADYYNGDNIADLTRFFDRYLKGIRNGWESTPTVRLDVMDAYDFDYQIKRAEENFPLDRTVYKKLYLDAAKGALSYELPANNTKVRYTAKKGRATFDIKFDEDTELTGYMKLHLWVEAEGHDDMDLFVSVQKLDKDGKFLPTNIIGAPHPGTTGRLRVSLRELDKEKTTDFRPQHTYNNPQKLKKGEVVPVDIEIWPLSRIWHKGEQLRIELAGFYHREDWFEPFDYDTINEGKHIIHTGGQYDSFLQVPYIPPKYVAGDYVYR
ncbi:MAG: CocE/NonD family hydrolase [Treponema sp.]|jgi:predicted acyl esterase|nr:CocE/NonD family hydrolase [Treponema sp.]